MRRQKEQRRVQKRRQFFTFPKIPSSIFSSGCQPSPSFAAAQSARPGTLPPQDRSSLPPIPAAGRPRLGRGRSRGSRRLASNHPSANMALDLLHVSSDEAGRRQRLIRYPRNFNSTGCGLLLSSCNGVLLFKRFDRSYILSNPATRKFAELPRVPHRIEILCYVYELAFYFHEPSDEYKLLCRLGPATNPKWYMLSTGGAVEQLQGQRIADMHLEASNRIADLLVATPVDLHGRLHWVPRQQTSNADEMVVFETKSETFHTRAGPPGAKHVKLFCMDGLLAAADFGVDNHINLWFLEDYAAGRWECRHHVTMPWHPQPSSTSTPHSYSWMLPGATTADGEGNVMLGNRKCLVVYNVRSQVVRRVDDVAMPNKDNVAVSRHVFKETLVPHRYFRARSPDELRFMYFWY